MSENTQAELHQHMREAWNSHEREEDRWNAIAAVVLASITRGMASVARSAALEAVGAERLRQVSVEGWTAEHDDEHDNGEMAMAAACYAAPDLILVQDKRANAVLFKDPWPWDEKWDKRRYVGNVLLPNHRAMPASRRRMLVKAGALILAEIERLDREQERFAAEMEAART